MTENHLDDQSVNIELEALAEERLIKFAEGLQDLILEATMGGTPSGLPELLELTAKNLRDSESNK